MVASRAVREGRSARRPACTTAVAAVLGALVLAGCGGGERQDVNEPSGTFSVDVTGVSFPRLQGLADTVPFRATVRNTGDQAIPNIAITLDGFSYKTSQPGVADPLRPLWVVNAGPPNGKTAYVNTWALGRLEAGQERTFVWSVTAVVPGTHTLNYRVAAGLNGKAKAVTFGDQPADGSVTVRVTQRPRRATVDPKTGEVIYRGQ